MQAPEEAFWGFYHVPYLGHEATVVDEHQRRTGQPQPEGGAPSAAEGCGGRRQALMPKQILQPSSKKEFWSAYAETTDHWHGELVVNLSSFHVHRVWSYVIMKKPQHLKIPYDGKDAGWPWGGYGKL